MNHLWKQEAVSRGIFWTSLWANNVVRTISCGVQMIMWDTLRAIDTGKDGDEDDDAFIIRRQVTPPKIPNPRHRINQYPYVFEYVDESISELIRDRFVLFFYTYNQ